MASEKWQNVSAGPRQVKDLQKAIGALQWEGKTFTEVTGVVGGEEHRSTMTSPFGQVRAEVTALDEAIRAKYGHQITRENVRAVIADYETALPEARKSRPVEDKRRSAEEDAELRAQMAEREAAIEAERNTQNALLKQVIAKAPHGAKALIIAEYHADASDPMTDYFASHTRRTVAIGFRFSSREDFRALHAAAAQFTETAGVEFTEHRDNHSMGAGNYLSDHGWAGAGTGWLIKSRDLPCGWVTLTEDAIPEAPPAPAETEHTASQPARPRRSTAISGDVMDILSRATAEGNAVRISDRLDRATYVAVNEVLAAAGGKWNRKAQAHLFPEDAAAVLAALQADGSVVRPQDEGYFPTPADVAAGMIALADLEPGMEVLEPSAGDGAIARTVAGLGCAVDCIELNPKRAGALCTAGYARTVTMADFLAVPQRAAYDRVMMNPPFADKADIAHVRHALGFLRPGGLLIAVMAGGVTFREDRATAGFRELVDEAGGLIEPLPEGAFKESGTGVNAVLAVIPAAEAASRLAAAS